ncbi:DEAD/DEAH box helicase family protein [Kosmotoga olearia]|uniref:Type III site-specific deoxyribonuclease n=1 Tax=Kosmotoga olearia (strain ATCC BAA-1733 / DSM 21960 / TBF 19.5.1) TaxID=521045 RepID=C5CHT4_KOSOT|nr:DEAD/DEAH box helicase family protein [Kosmotoga olearia]ACR78790.1 Type III site-specific deoxyribonuclease [Kosmotoga olearia TBF 19.5.1]
MPDNQRLNQEYDILSKMGYLKKDIPKYIEDNLNPRFKLRPYQIEAIARFIHYLEENPNRKRPTQLLFNMATGSGKTLLMAANILYLYNKGYRNFLFFVNSTNIIEKTRDNFLNLLSPKYLFNQRIKFEDKEVVIREVSNFDEANEEDINIIFTTIQGLHSQLNLFRENSITFEDLKDKKIVLISDEAHHINAWTRNRLSKTEEMKKTSWEYTVMQILNSNPENILLEYTATIDLENPSIYSKYKDKIIFEYDLKQFRIDGYSKEVKVLQADLENWERMLQAVILSQYRRKIAERNGIRLKPVILFKSRSIKESKENYELFRERMDNMSEADIEAIKSNSTGTVLERVFNYFENEGINVDNLITELKEDFSEEKCILLDSENIDKEKQIRLNTLEDENNEIRAIFAVKMLDEGWDVLNLFDIVRLYDTRDGRWTRDGRYIPGNTTIAERQLIGRGARYYPFKINEEDDLFKRKFDNQPENPLKILEELYYHSKYNPRYIQELTTALKEYGIMPYEEKEIQLRVKPDIKNTEFWKKGFLFVNKKVEADRRGIKTIDDIEIERTYKYILPTGFLREDIVLQEETTRRNSFETTTRTFRLGDFGDVVIRKAMAKLDFYRFSNLKRYFPDLNSSKEFIESLKKINVDITSSREKLDDLTPDDKLKACLNVLLQLENEILNEYVEYKGTEVFVPIEIKEVVKDKQLKINVGDYGDQEYGIPMSNAKHPYLQLNLANKDWYIYDENYGTYEEKSFVKFIDGVINELRQKYSEVYLLRNANLFKIYRFSDGKAMEPDFVLFLRREDSKEIEQYQLFIETKGEHLIKTDQWKEDFLKEIEEKYSINLKATIFGENEKYRLIGLPFYNEGRKNEFINEFKKKLGL